MVVVDGFTGDGGNLVIEIGFGEGYGWDPVFSGERSGLDQFFFRVQADEYERGVPGVLWDESGSSERDTCVSGLDGLMRGRQVGSDEEVEVLQLCHVVVLLAGF